MNLSHAKSQSYKEVQAEFTESNSDNSVSELLVELVVLAV